MLRRTPLAPERTDCRNIRFESLLLGTVRSWRQFDKRMQRHLHPRALLLRHIHVVSVDTSQYSLVCHNNDVLAPFQLHNDRFKTDDNIAVGFATAVAVIVFVLVAGTEIFRVAVCDLLVGEAVADAGVELVEGFPFKLAIAGGGGGKEARSLDGAFQGGGPDGQLTVVTK